MEFPDFGSACMAAVARQTQPFPILPRHGPSQPWSSPVGFRVQTSRKRPAIPPLRVRPVWSDPEPRSTRQTRHRDAPVPAASPPDPEITERPRRSTTSTPAPNRSRGGGLPQQFLTCFSLGGSSASRTCTGAIVQPRRAAYSAWLAVASEESAGQWSKCAHTRPAHNIFGTLCRWPKTLSDFAFWEARLAATWRDLSCREHDPFSARQDSSYVSRWQLLAVIPGHP